MYKMGLTDGANARLQSLVAEKKAGSRLEDLLEETPRPVVHARRTSRKIVKPDALEETRYAWRDPESDQDIIMKVLQEGTGGVEDEGSDLMKDTLHDMQKSKGVNTGTAPKKPKGLGKNLFKKDWTLKASRRFLSFLKRSYDIRNFYNASRDSAMDPLSISVSLGVPSTGSEKNLDDLQGYVSDVISQSLNLGGEHHLLVTASAGGPPVSVNLEGVSPDKEPELRTLIEGLAVEAVSTFADHKG